MILNFRVFFSLSSSVKKAQVRNNNAYRLVLHHFQRTCRSALLTARAVGVDVNVIHTDLFKGEHLKPDFLKEAQVFIKPASMPIDLYYLPASAPCRSALLTAKAVGVDVNVIQTDLFAGAHLKPDFLKLNPRHAVPVLNDNGYVLCESRAIMGYLVDQYAKDDSLYPKDTKKRSLVNERLYFDIGTLYQRFFDYYCRIMYMGDKPDPVKFKSLEDAFGFLNTYLEGQPWVAGDHMTIADIDIVTTVTSCETMDFDVSKYPNVAKWLAKAKKTLPGYDEVNRLGCDEYRKLWEKLGKNKK